MSEFDMYKVKEIDDNNSFTVERTDGREVVLPTEMVGGASFVQEDGQGGYEVVTQNQNNSGNN